MESFIETVTDDHFRELLEVAIMGSGAFGRFRDILRRDEGEQQRWFAFQQEQVHSQAQRWLVSEGLNT